MSPLFSRLPALIAAAPTQKEPPFLVTQLIVLAMFLWLGRVARRGCSAGSVVSAGTALSPTRRRLEAAKDELRALYGQPRGCRH
jgi:hypothetical protein